MTIFSRLDKAEQAAEQASGQGRPRLFVYYQDQTTGADGTPRTDEQIMGTLDGEPMSLAGFQKIRREGDTELVVRFVDTPDGEQVSEEP